jgi:hypothetical protein
MLFCLKNVTSLGEQEPHSIYLSVECWKVCVTSSTYYCYRWTVLVLFGFLLKIEEIKYTGDGSLM